MTISGEQPCAAPKSTIYRWWRSKAELVMEAYDSTASGAVPDPDTGSAVEDITQFVRALHANAADPVRARALRSLMAEAQLDRQFEEAFRGWVQGRRRIVWGMLDRGQQRGELRDGIDFDVVVDELFGLFWYRLLVGHLPLDRASADLHVRHLLRSVVADA